MSPCSIIFTLLRIFFDTSPTALLELLKTYFPLPSISSLIQKSRPPQLIFELPFPPPPTMPLFPAGEFLLPCGFAFFDLYIPPLRFSHNKYLMSWPFDLSPFSLQIPPFPHQAFFFYFGLNRFFFFGISNPPCTFPHSNCILDFVFCSSPPAFFPRHSLL